ncbi:uncharacterized protein LOC133191732 [Saccostrea echinata]|uniref:uncharacterized protein LOC133191732 n=1 Tax=Saccostrea echinata TaxID=191078 RepID=UPI002A813E4A|nr:uncharacterized protein LOC133191732 [Saccostrea echinata]
MMAESSSSSSGWEFVDKEGRSLESSDDNQSETSESSIEVVTMDTSDPQSLESIQEPLLPSPTSGSYLVLRLRSKEKDSLTESDESDHHQDRDQGNLKRRKKSKSKFPKSQDLSFLSSGLLTPSEEERDFETIPDPQKEKAENCPNKGEKETVEELAEEEIQNSLQAGENGPMQSFQVLEAPCTEDQEPLNPPPFIENGGVDQGSREEEEDFMFLGVPQDDPDTESSPEMADEQDDRIESDRSDDRHSDDFSTLSNVDISDLMAENNLIRQYVFRPNPTVNVTLNLVMVVVISIAVGLGIGHAIGTAKERFVNMNLREMSVNIDEDGHCQFDMEDVEKLTVENIALKKEANKAQNEVVDLRSEVMKLRYSSIVTSAEEEKRTANKKNLELKLEVNKLQHENEDLKKLVGSLKYGSHPGNEEGKLLDDELQKSGSLISSCAHKRDNEHDEMEEEMNDSINEVKTEENMESLSDGQREGDKKHVSIIDVVHPFPHNLDIDYHVTESSEKNDIEDKIEDSNNERSSEQISQSENKIDRMPGVFPSGDHKNVADRSEESEQLQGSEVNIEYPGTNIEKGLKLDPLEGECEGIGKIKDIEEEMVWEDSSEIKSESLECGYEDIEEDVEILDEDLGDEVVEDEDVSNTSSESILNAEEQPNSRSGGQGSEENNFKKENSQSSMKTDWRETMHKILNKTKASVSVVSQQIQDTWKQVKNMSEDLWKKNEPVLTKLKSNVVMNVEEAAQKISAKLEGARNWLRHHRAYPRHKQNDDYYTEKRHKHKNHHWRNHKEDKYPRHKQNDDMYQEKNKKDSKFFKARTGRRSFQEEKDDDKPWAKHQRKAERFERKRDRKFQKIKRRFEKMHEYQFCKMNMKKRQKFFNILEDFDERFSADKMYDADHMWYSCQWDWWWNAMSFHLNNFMLMDPNCQGTLLPWQEGILVSGRWECPGFPQNLNKQNQFTFKFHDYEDDDDDDDDDDESSEKHFNSMPYFGNLNLQQTNNDTEEFRGCDPTKGLCDYNKYDSWYLKKMKFRQYQRFIDTTEKGKTEWMFARANYRRHEREKTDCSPGVHGVYVCG